MPDSLAVLQQALHGFRIRILRLHGERMAVRGLLVAAVLACLLVILDLLTVWYLTLPQLLALAPIGALVGWLYARWRRPSELEIAFTIERAAPALHERASTALTLTSAVAGHALSALICNDAAGYVATLSPRELLPRRVTRIHHSALLGWTLALLLFLLPFFPLLYSPQARQQRANMQLSGKHLAGLAQELAKNPELAETPQGQQLLRAMKKLAAEIAQQRLPREEALQRLNDLQLELNNLAGELARQYSDATLSQAARDLEKMLAQRNAEEREMVEKAQQQLAAGARRDELSESLRAALQREEGLQQAAAALRAGDATRAQSALSNANASLAELPAIAAADTRRQQAFAQTEQGLEQSWQAMNNSDTVMAAANGENSEQTGMDGNEATNITGNNGQPQPSQNPSSSAGVQGDTATAESGGQGQGDANSAGDQGESESPGDQPGGPGGVGTGGSGGGHLGGAGERMEGTGYNPHLARGQFGQGTTIVLPGAAPYGSGALGASSVPYYDVFSDYAKRAEHAMTGDQVPLEDRQRVRDYFDRLNPRR